MGRWHGRSWVPAAAAVAIALVAAPASGGPSASSAARAAPDLRLAAPGGRALSGSWQRWARASLMPTVGGRVTLKLTGRPALPRAAGCVYRRRPRTIYLRPGLRHPRAVLLHELGHLYDLRVMNNGDRGGSAASCAQAGAHGGPADPARRAVRRGLLVLRALPPHRLDRALLDLRLPASRRQHAKVCALVLDAAVDRRPSAPPPRRPPSRAPTRRRRRSRRPPPCPAPAAARNPGRPPRRPRRRRRPRRPPPRASAGADDPADPPGLPAPPRSPRRACRPARPRRW